MRWLDHTVWGRDSIPPTERRFRGLTQFVLPVTDLSVVFFSAVGWLTASFPNPSHTGHTFAAWWAGSLVIAAILALIGVSVPKLWPVELVGRLGYLSLLVGFLALAVGPALHDVETAASLVLSATLLWLPAWRVSDLGYVWWTRRHQETPR